MWMEIERAWRGWSVWEVELLLTEQVTAGIQHCNDDEEKDDDGASPVAEDQAFIRSSGIRGSGSRRTQEGQQLLTQVGFHGLVGCSP